MIYSGDMSQSMLGVRNTDKVSAFLIQSWIENESVNKSNDFVITPPLYVLKPASESVIKVIFNSKKLPQDRETLYWLTVKAIPQETKNATSNTLKFASANRIKLFYRPEGLNGNSNQAWKEINGELSQGKIKLNNPTPYYLTTINLKIDGKAVKPVMIPPKASVTLEGTYNAARQFTYQTINDYGAWTSPTTNSLAKY